MEKKDFLASIEVLSQVYDKEPKIEQIKVWWKLFKHIESDRFLDAVNKHVLDADKGTFYPRPADLVRHLKNGARGKLEALSAWDYLNSCVRFGAECLNPISVHLFNSLALANCTEVNHDFKKRDFLEQYDLILNNAKSTDFLYKKQPWLRFCLSNEARNEQQRISARVHEMHGKGKFDQKFIDNDNKDVDTCARLAHT